MSAMTPTQGEMRGQGLDTKKSGTTETQIDLESLRTHVLTLKQQEVFEVDLGLTPSCGDCFGDDPSGEPQANLNVKHGRN